MRTFTEEEMAPKATCCAASAILAVRTFTNSALPSSVMGVLADSAPLLPAVSPLSWDGAPANGLPSCAPTSGRACSAASPASIDCPMMLPLCSGLGVRGLVRRSWPGAKPLEVPVSRGGSTALGAGFGWRGRLSGRGGRPREGSAARAGAMALLAWAGAAWAPVPKGAQSSGASSAVSSAMPSPPGPRASTSCVSTCTPTVHCMTMRTSAKSQTIVVCQSACMYMMHIR